MEKGRDSGQLLWGIVLVALGLLFLSGNFGYRTWFDWDRWWPVLLIVLGVIMLYRRSTEGVRADAPPGVTPPAGAPPAPSAPPQDVPVSAETGQAQDKAAAASRRYPMGAIILIGVGVAFLLDDIIGGNAFPALLLIAIGIALLLRQRGAA